MSSNVSMNLANCLVSLADLEQQHQQHEFQQLRLILGDQLNASHSWFSERNNQTLYLMMEMRQETDYVKHHQQKLLGFFGAMRGFATALAEAGHKVLYLSLDNSDNQQSLLTNLQQVMGVISSNKVGLQQPDEYRLDHQLRSWAGREQVELEWFDSEHFLTARDALKRYFPNKKTYLMETFYRQIRREYDILMDGKKPTGGKWNYDHDNRNKLPKDHQTPAPKLFGNNLSSIEAMLHAADVASFGNADAENFLWPVNRKQSRQLLDFFVTNCLEDFGRYQDAMATNEWSIYHSRLSFSLNTKMLSPLEVVHKALAFWQDNQEKITLAQIEGFVRQIIGWREFVRAIYWHHMPEYKSLNYFEFDRSLPAYYWNGETKMSCMQQSIQQSLDYAYAHHIQRLMVTGNFALLTEINPDQVDDWYLGVYIDAIEWVEMPNTRGMSQYADGGIVGSKPYISSGRYINKMSNYCASCHYNVNQTTGDNACPFNSLYWRFIDKQQQRLQDNHRMRMIISLWGKRDPDDKKAILAQAQQHLIHIESL
ncbi:MAG: cryptochrome/photolyase family protein [Idiomarina sp.]